MCERVDIFMRKLLFVIAAIIVFLIVYINVNASEIVIPGSAIRFRVVANSNSIKDQSMKMLVKEFIDEYLVVKMMDIDDVDVARSIINDELYNIRKEIKEIFDKNNYSEEFVVHYGKNFFPSKLYKGVNYESGNYESLVVTIGKGNGDNWWCVLFPPLCLLEATESEVKEVDYQFFVKELIDSIFE